MMRFDFRQFDHTGRVTGLYNRVAARPGWVTRAAIAAAVLVVVVPLLFLALAGLMVGAVVFIVLGLVARVMGFFAGFGGNAPGSAAPPAQRRRNVRVMDE